MITPFARLTTHTTFLALVDPQPSFTVCAYLPLLVHHCSGNVEGKLSM